MVIQLYPNPLDILNPFIGTKIKEDISTTKRPIAETTIVFDTSIAYGSFLCDVT